nr:hypothetical protein [Escherichia coli]
MTELAKKQNWLWLNQTLLNLRHSKLLLMMVVKRQKLVCTNNQGDLVPLLTQK